MTWFKCSDASHTMIHYYDQKTYQFNCPDWQSMPIIQFHNMEKCLSNFFILFHRPKKEFKNDKLFFHTIIKAFFALFGN